MEYGWHVYKHSDGTFTYTFPTKGTATEVNHANLLRSKSGKFKYKSTGHTHLDDSVFSGQDINFVTQETLDENDDLPLYLAAPDGRLYFMSPRVARNASSPDGAGKVKSAYVDLPSENADDKGVF